MVEQSGVSMVLRQNTFEVAEGYRFAGTPSAVLVSADGKVASGTVAGAEAIRNLVSRIVSPQPQAPARPAQPAVGQAAPEFALPDLNDQTVTLDLFAGDRVLLVAARP